MVDEISNLRTMRNLHPQIDALLDRRDARERELAALRKRIREKGLDRYFPHYFRDEAEEPSAQQWPPLLSTYRLDGGGPRAVFSSRRSE